MNKLFLGLDTSNYKTSVSLVDEQGDIVFNKSEYLSVPQGKKGLRQSEAFFNHSNRLPGYISEALKDIPRSDISAIGVSDKPRRVEGSYMPCFMAGLNAALEMGSALDIPVFRFSHQEGHAAAIIHSLGHDETCAFLHLSGGTTEFLVCRQTKYGYDMEIAGGTKDISFGQLLDRVGVALGLEFPSGVFLDDISIKAMDDGVRLSKVLPKVKISDGQFNLSGAETRALRFIESDPCEAEVSGLTVEIFKTISDIISGSSEYMIDKYNVSKVYVAGGVASSRSVRRLLSTSKISNQIIFGDPVLSGDNAVGIARLACRIFSNETGNSNTGK